MYTNLLLRGKVAILQGQCISHKYNERPTSYFHIPVSSAELVMLLVEERRRLLLELRLRGALDCPCNNASSH